MTFKNDMNFEDVEKLMNELFASNLHFLDKIEFSNKFMDGETTKEIIEGLIH